MEQQELTEHSQAGARPFLATGIGVCVVGVLCNLLWGSAFPCVKIGYRLFQVAQTDVFSQMLFAGLRFALAGVLSIILGSIGAKKLLKPKRESLRMVGVLSIFQTILHYACFYLGLANTSGVKGSIITATHVFVSILISGLLFRMEKLTVRKVVGCLIGFVGVVLANLNGGSLGGDVRFMGEGLMLIATLSNGIATVFTKRYSAYENPVTLSGYQFVLGGTVLATVGILGGGQLHAVDATAYGMLMYLGFLSAVAYSLWGLLLKHNPVSRVAIYGCLNPVFGVLLSALLLGETAQAFTWQSMLSLMLVSLGIAVVNWVWERKKTPASAM